MASDNDAAAYNALMMCQNRQWLSFVRKNIEERTYKVRAAWYILRIWCSNNNLFSLPLIVDLVYEKLR